METRETRRRRQGYPVPGLRLEGDRGQCWVVGFAVDAVPRW